jgi:hypothetical protein
MTLILASIRPHDLVLTADGRSSTMSNGKVNQIDDHYQKLLPIPDHSMAYHHTLMTQAIDAKVDPNTVDGMVHELVITPAEWKWTQPPTAPPDTQSATR